MTDGAGARHVTPSPGRVNEMATILIVVVHV